MFRPKIPTMPAPTGLGTPPAVVEPTAITPNAGTPPVAPQAPTPVRPTGPARPWHRPRPRGRRHAVVLVLGAVLVSLLLAVAITGASVAVCAVVLRSLLTSDAKRR
ncbi:SpdD-like protein [Streptomyces sp. PBH53]|nr:SpdD-like protein [Streptomyces sp. PBH53]